jgi:hypothetical protein
VPIYQVQQQHREIEKSYETADKVPKYCKKGNRESEEVGKDKI